MRFYRDISANREACLGVAAGLLGSFGPVDGGVKVKAAAVEEVVGLSRSTVLRLWPSRLELATDLVLHAATGREGWFRRILRYRPDGPIRESFTKAIGLGSGEMGTTFRGVVATWPRTSDTYQRVQAWELEWLAQFSAWLGRALMAARVEPRGGVSVDDLAVLVTGMVEGQLLVDAIRCAPSRTRTPQLNERIALTVELLLREATTPISEASAGADASPPVDASAPPGAARCGQRRCEVLDALIEADVTTVAPSMQVIEPTRLVHPARLARRLGVSDRRLRMLWPTNSAFNADLTGYLIDHQLDGSEQVVEELFPAALRAAPSLAEHGGHTRAELDLQLTVPPWDQVDHTGDAQSHGHALSSLAAVLEPRVAARAHQVLDAHLREGQVLLLATMQALEAHFRPAVGPAVYMGPMYGARFGFERLTLTHPELEDREVNVGEIAKALFGFGYESIYRSMACEAVNDGAAHDHTRMPSL